MSVAATSGTTQAKPKRAMSIEQAISWAFREELPKQRADQKISAAPTQSVHPMWRASVFGGRIDNWNNHDPGFPLAMGEPHPDAILIENAVKGCDVDRLDLWGFLIPYRIGEQFDLAGLLEKARRETVAVMINCATSRTRPDCSDQVQLEPVRSITGQITVWVRETRQYEDAAGQPILVPHDLPTKPVRKGVYPSGAFSKIQYLPSAATVALDRAKYAAWWAGCQHVAELLRVMGLDTIEITGFDAPKMPWVDPPAEIVKPTLMKSALRPVETTARVAQVPAPAPRDDVEAHTFQIRDQVLKDRRNQGRRRNPRRHSEVRQIFPRPEEPAETA